MISLISGLSIAVPQAVLFIMYGKSISISDWFNSLFKFDK